MRSSSAMWPRTSFSVHLPARVGQAADALVVQRLEEQDGLAPLGDEGRDRVVAGDEVDVGLRVGGDLVVAGASRDAWPRGG